MINNKIKLEYIWLDGYKTPNLRSKVKVIDSLAQPESIQPQDLPIWNFDGSSTRQAPGNSSECLLKPVRCYSDGTDTVYVLCEVLNTDNTPHPSNTRASLRETYRISKNEGFWWGFEQEYFITKDYQPLGFPSGGYPKPQGLYYCGVGGNQVVGRKFVEHHLNWCLAMKIELTGINAEVAVGQWEYQCFSKDTLKACDDLWMSRYLLYRLAEEYGWDINISPKPVSGDWNGSGCHTNFSTKAMREPGGIKVIEEACKSLEKVHDEHIAVYGADNDQRLTGLHETCSMTEFRYGVSDRGASIRIPMATANDGFGYLEDRRPSANVDPYEVCFMLMETVCTKKMAKV